MTGGTDRPSGARDGRPNPYLPGPGAVLGMLMESVIRNKFDLAAVRAEKQQMIVRANAIRDQAESILGKEPSS